MSCEDSRVNKDTQSNGTRIAKNTVYMYTRTLVMMIVTLFTSRVALRALGEDDFGIYNLVAGIVVFFGFLNYAMERASLRFLLVEKGTGTQQSMLRVFNLSVTSHLLISAAVIVLGESIGLWFVNTQLNIPAESYGAMNVVYQTALLTTVFNVVRVPYNASIVAYEKMSFYAWFSVAEAVFRLGAVYAILLLPQSIRLQGYAISWTLVAIVAFLAYKFFCTHNFKTCNFRFLWEKAKFVEMLKFSGWSLLGGIGNISAQQGISIILNIFLGVAVNAAVGITYQVGQAVNNVISSFQTAFNPYIVKTYAKGEIEKFRNSLTSTSKYSLFLISMMIVPIFLNINLILNVWLGNDVPQYTAQFCCIYLVFYAIDAMSAPLWMANQATGKVMVYNIVWTILLLLNLPICWICLKMQLSPTSVFWTRVVVNGVIHGFRIIYLHYQVGLEVLKYVMQSIVVPVIVLAVGVIIPVVLYMFTEGWVRLCITLPVSLISIAAAIWLLGLDRQEKQFVREMIKRKRA